MAHSKHFGRYRATVVGNVDPMQVGRIQVEVPAVLGATTAAWAMPCFPLAGEQTGAYLVRQWARVSGSSSRRGTSVHRGGYFRSAAEVPALTLDGVASSPRIVFQTPAQNSLMISDMPGRTGGIMLRSSTGASIVVNDTGIYIHNGRGATIELTGATVDVNAGALVVT